MSPSINDIIFEFIKGSHTVTYNNQNKAIQRLNTFCGAIMDIWYAQFSRIRYLKDVSFRGCQFYWIGHLSNEQFVCYYMPTT